MNVYPGQVLDRTVDCRMPSVCEEIVLCIGNSGVFDQVLEVTVRTTTP